ncbi:PspA-associated protein PspAB [Amycolatopsis kentuckyensis]|uniref:PspA-associated protein PspAB n=1 Tax=Amycolatopsis kentuckyensis TaxID=218823 RepID=UPI003567F27B
MTLLDSKLVRCWTSRPHLQSLYALAAAAPRMRAALGLAPTGGGTVGFKVDGDALARTEAELIAATSARLPVHPLVTQDLHGRSTVRCWRRDHDLRVLTGDLVDVADRLARAGYGGCLRSATVEFAEQTGRRDRKLALVYLFGRGTFHTAAASGAAPLDRALELRARAALHGALPLEPHAHRRFVV